MSDTLGKLRMVVPLVVGFTSLIMSLTAVGAMMFMSVSADHNILHKFGWLLPVVSLPLFLLFFFSHKAYAGSMMVLAALNYVFLVWFAWIAACPQGNCRHMGLFGMVLRPVATGPVILPLFNAAVALLLDRREKSTA